MRWPCLPGTVLATHPLLCMVAMWRSSGERVVAMCGAMCVAMWGFGTNEGSRSAHMPLSGDQSCVHHEWLQVHSVPLVATTTLSQTPPTPHCTRTTAVVWQLAWVPVCRGTMIRGVWRV
jgi:hypothetical protein